MSRLTLRLPETLHQQLTRLSEGEGVSLNQYIVYALTRQAALAYTVRVVPEEEVKQQKQAFDELLQRLGTASAEEVEAALATREVGEPEPELSPEIVARLRQKIQDAAKHKH
ncbi:toxin-antitoxin system HicB family antitoxin [Romeria aff. gracilis LEGE 07310]|uniref:Toxin-antitoxin system HicB family antitoxin n=1 Tax=Vasconcelosia minhoensis LEGE 07310 TaxID=915328 RepID=A0A8J7AYF1_9CYAN|nr:YlcI/YnfO family protein [Romeria gracilis]MBE9080088.1 toxin-antitoxin system HicB family antitoxin [Romeria aff. gracilis LEGE 07310]